MTENRIEYTGGKRFGQFWRKSETPECLPEDSSRGLSEDGTIGQNDSAVVCRILVKESRHFTVFVVCSVHVASINIISLGH